MTDRTNGDLRAPGALARFLKKNKWPAMAATAEQVHGHRIAIISRRNPSQRFRGVDGLLTDCPGQPLAIFTADCASVFLSDKKQSVVGVLHAGWRGVQSNILRQAIRIIRKKWHIRPQEMQVWMGSSIGPCCFEVQWDVARHFPRTRRRAQGRWTVDLGREIKAQARRLGLGGVHKKSLEGCTMHGSRYFSYRRDKTSKRQASIIMKRQPS